MSESDNAWRYVTVDWVHLLKAALWGVLVIATTWAALSLVLALVMPPEAYKNIRWFWKPPAIVTGYKYYCEDFYWNQMPQACREELARKTLGGTVTSSGNTIQTAPAVKELKQDPPDAK